MSDRVPPGYSLGSTDAELRRLIELAAHEVDHVIEACRRAYVDSGATVLDLGCGPLGALVPLAGVVGRQGKVIGVDASAAALARARTLLPAEAFPHVRFVEGDVNEIGRDALGIVRVDAAYARLMLLHQADPARTVRNVARLLRKGGVSSCTKPPTRHRTRPLRSRTSRR